MIHSVTLNIITVQALVKLIPHKHEFHSQSISSMASLLNQTARHAEIIKTDELLQHYSASS